MEKLVVEFMGLPQILLLHLLSDPAVLAIRACSNISESATFVNERQRTFLWEEKLVYDDIMRVNLVRR